MKRFKFLPILSLFILSANLLHAQAKEVDLKDCLHYALTHNQNLAIKKYEELEGDQKVIQARSQALPQVNGNANFTDNFKKQVIVLPGEFVGEPGKTIAVEAGTTYNTTASADVSQQLFNASVFTALKAATVGTQYYKLNTQLSEEDVINQTARLYYQILATGEQINVLDTTIRNLEKLVVSTEGQYKNGLARKIDLDRIRVNATNSKTKLTQAENQLIISTNQLKVLMGMPIEEEIALRTIHIDDIEKKLDENVMVADFNADNLTEVKLLDVQQKLYTLQKKVSQSAYYPTLSAFGNYSYNGVSNNFGDMFKKGGQDIWYGIGSFGLKLQVPIFDGFARRSKVAMDGIALKKLEQQKANTMLSLNAGYKSAKLSLLNNISTIKAQKENVDLASAVYYSSSQNYSLGLATLTDLLDAENSFADAQNSYTQALLNYKLAELETLKSTGNIKTLLNN